MVRMVMMRAQGLSNARDYQMEEYTLQAMISKLPRAGPQYIFVVWLFICCSYVQAAKLTPVAVIYPEIREPYKTVFMQIIDGIEQTSGVSVHPYMLQAEQNRSEQLPAWITSKNIQIAVVLGKQGVDQISNIPEEIPVIVGGVLCLPVVDKRKFSGVVLTPDPYVMFKRLKWFSPDIKKVIVAYSNEYNGWLINIAQEAASRLGIALEARQADTLMDAAAFYRKLIEDGVDRKSAIWLLHDEIISDQKTLLPMLLKEAWDKRFIIFSNNPAAVNRGALFSFYPDNKNMGEDIGKKVSQMLINNSFKYNEASFIRDMRLVVNVRTIEHLGIALSKDQVDEFDLVFPAGN